MNRKSLAQVPKKKTLSEGRLLRSTLRDDTCKGVREAALDRGKCGNKGFSPVLRELCSWEGLSEMSPVEPRGLGPCAPTSMSNILGRGSSLQLKIICGERPSCQLTTVLAAERMNA